VPGGRGADEVELLLVAAPSPEGAAADIARLTERKHFT